MDESWLIPYTDLLTLLLALFIVLFAISSVDQAKYNAIKEALYTAFNGNIPEGSAGGDIPSEIILPYPPTPGADNEKPPGGDGDGAGPLGNLYASMKAYIHDNGLEYTVGVEYQGDNVLITLKNDVWFSPGSAELTDNMREQAEILAEVLKENQNPENPFDIIVAGFTDNVPINTSILLQP